MLMLSEVIRAQAGKMAEHGGLQRRRLDHERPHCSSSSAASEEKYGLRPRTIIKRLQQERVRQEVPKRAARPKSRPAPLSKYRRKTANARERHRMKEINNAFESLRKVLPDVMEVEAASSSLTKITTLRLAVNYIRTLSHLLEGGGVSSLENSLLENSLQQSLQCSLENSLQQSLQCSLENSLQCSLENFLQCSLENSLQRSFCRTTPPPDNTVTAFHYQYSTPPLSQHFLPEAPHFSSYYSTSSHNSVTSSPSTMRGSLGSASDPENLLSDDSGLLEDNLDVFHDIPTLSVADPLDVLLGAERDALVFTTELCN
ncbi:helix-loop-helix protein delilah-like [Homarus americanus]|uniref:helix-loop-helix protein delilah-like n=1 Tax=Homarus americanus TaxID=6706 RepID=UPI001C486CC8|nr:helix-loop-helix protein delilah-like [Homarus americanus]